MPILLPYPNPLNVGPTPGLSRGPRGATLASSSKQRDTRDRRLQAEVRQPTISSPVEVHQDPPSESRREPWCKEDRPAKLVQPRKTASPRRDHTCTASSRLGRHRFRHIHPPQHL